MESDRIHKKGIGKTRHSKNLSSDMVFEQPLNNKRACCKYFKY